MIMVTSTVKATRIVAIQTEIQKIKNKLKIMQKDLKKISILPLASN